MEMHDHTSRSPSGTRPLFLALFAGLVLALAAPSQAAFTLYDNGAINPAANALGITGPLVVSNSFVLTTDSTIQIIDGIGLMCVTDSTPVSFTWSLGTAAFGTDITGPNTTTPISVKVGTNPLGYDVFSSLIETGNISLSAGTYWFTLSNCTSSFSGNDEVFWTYSNGPSTAFQQDGANTPVSNPSEAFTIVGVPEPSTLALSATAATLLVLAARRRSLQP